MRSMQGNAVKTDVQGHTQGREQVGLIWFSIRPPGVIYSHLLSRLSCPHLCTHARAHAHTHKHPHTHTHTIALGGPAPTLRHPTQ